MFYCIITLSQSRFEVALVSMINRKWSLNIKIKQHIITGAVYLFNHMLSLVKQRSPECFQVALNDCSTNILKSKFEYFL